MTTTFRFPFRTDGLGRTATADPRRAVADMIDQLVLTMRGERVNRPDFGAGLCERLFDHPGPDMLAAAEAELYSQLSQGLGQAIRIDQVDIVAVEATLEVTVVYTVLLDQYQASRTLLLPLEAT